MKHPMRKLAMAAIAVITFGLITGQCRNHWHDSDANASEISEKIADRVADKLDLDENQETKTKALVEDLVIAGKNMKEKRGGITEELQKQFESDSFNSTELEQLSGTFETDLQDFRKLMISRLGEFHGILNAEQRKEAAEILARINDRHKR